MDAFLLSFAVIFVAELGDKSQLMALTFATRFPALSVLVAITIATAIIHLGSVLLGATVARLIPTNHLDHRGGGVPRVRRVDVARRRPVGRG